MWNIHTTRQYKKWQITKESIISLLCSKAIDGASLDKALIFWSALLHKDSLKFRLLFILIPKSFSHLLLEIVLHPIMILLESLPERRRLYLPELAFILLSLNHLKVVFPMMMIMMMMMMMMMMNCFCGMVGRRKAFSLILSRDYCQRPSPSQISDTLRARFELTQNLSWYLVEWSCEEWLPLHHGPTNF